MALELPSWDRLLANSALPRVEARALLALASGRTREWLAAHGDEPAPRDPADRFLELARRRRDRGEPIAYLTGEREFHGRVFRVDPNVLIPRPETELLVDTSLELGDTALVRGGAPHGPEGAGHDVGNYEVRALDLGTGSGCIAISLACMRKNWQVLATDRSVEALAITRANAQRLCPSALASGRLEFRLGNWWEALADDAPGGEARRVKSPAQFDLIVSNPPYVAAGDGHLAQGDLRFEPASALVAGIDGLDAIRVIAAGARARLAVHGWLAIEHGYDQGPAVRDLFADAGLVEICTRRDAACLERITFGRRA